MEAESPATRVIRLLGAKRIAAHCDLTTDAVWKWAKRGGGMIPARYQFAILGLAEREGKPLLVDEIIGRAPSEPASVPDDVQ